jgi:hypothetical protein
MEIIYHWGLPLKIEPIEKETPVIVNTTASTNVQSYKIMGISILCLAALLYFFSLKKLTVPNPLG